MEIETHLGMRERERERESERERVRGTTRKKERKLLFP
jgi:hypothetical protein